MIRKAVISFCFFWLSMFSRAQFPPIGISLDMMMFGNVEAAIRNRQFGSIIDASRRYLNEHPKSWGAWWYSAAAWHRLHNYAQADSAYIKAISFATARPEVVSYLYFWKARNFYDQKNFQQAYDAFSLCLSGSQELIKRQKESVYYYRGRSALELKQYDRTIEDMDADISRSSNPLQKGDNYYYKGLAEHGLGQFESATKSFTLSLSNYAVYYSQLPAKVYLARAQCYDKLEKYDLAIADLDRLIKKAGVFDDEKKLDVLVFQAKELKAGILKKKKMSIPPKTN